MKSPYALVGAQRGSPSSVRWTTASMGRELTRLEAENSRLRAALERIEKWHGEFPSTGRTWDDGSPMSYSAAFGSNGERDYMRAIARRALGMEEKTDGKAD